MAIQFLGRTYQRLGKRRAGTTMAASELIQICHRRTRLVRQLRFEVGFNGAEKLAKPRHVLKHSEMLSLESSRLCIARILQSAMAPQTARVDNKQIRFQNLLALIRETGSKAELSRRTGVNEAYLSQIVKRGGQPSDRKVGDDMARQLETGIGKPYGWMDHDHSGLDNGNTEAAAAQLYGAPEISWLQAGKFNGVEEFAEKFDEHPIVPSAVQLGKGSFALRVRGDSMTAPAGIRTYPDGCKIIVDPSIEPKPGMRVVVRLDGVDEATFKELTFDAGQYFLRPLNPQYPILPMPEGARIIGVVVGTWTGE